MFLGLSIGAWAQNIRLTWVGQACFIVQSEGGPTIITDPVPPPLGYAIPEVPTDGVTITHDHGDHTFTAGVRGNFTVVDGRPISTRTHMTVANLPFILIPGFHDGQNGSALGPNTIIQWTQSALRLAHLGDLGQDQLTEAQLADLQNLDVVFIPAGGIFTIDAVQAAVYAKQIGARVTILMHYRTGIGGPPALDALPAVASAFGTVAYKPSSVVISRATLPALREVWVMEPAAPAVLVNAGAASGGAVAPGSLASVFGSFAGSETLASSDYPLPRKLGQAEVLIQGNAVPLLFVSPHQINLQIPSLLGPGQYPAEVRVAGQTLARLPVTVVPRAPGVFFVANQDGRCNSASNAARRGETMEIYGTGAGLVPLLTLPPPFLLADGAVVPGSSSAFTQSMPEVTVGGRRAAVKLSGLRPGFVGLWQIQAVVPSDAPTGPTVPVTVRYGSITSTITAAIQ
ncbi:MAG: MBL fold metallo-hydrolase [Acidobacteria bacterium]|nr:MBL fold metallo-hydrolase [Acidobacteriota bacterium]